MTAMDITDEDLGFSLGLLPCCRLKAVLKPFQAVYIRSPTLSPRTVSPARGNMVRSYVGINTYALKDE
jgi:hypothetical protein